MAEIQARQWRASSEVVSLNSARSQNSSFVACGLQQPDNAQEDLAFCAARQFQLFCKSSVIFCLTVFLFPSIIYINRFQSRVSQRVTLHFESKPVSVLCHMGDFGCGDGGWTPVMKINGNKVQWNLY